MSIYLPIYLSRSRSRSRPLSRPLSLSLSRSRSRSRSLFLALASHVSQSPSAQILETRAQSTGDTVKCARSQNRAVQCARMCHSSQSEPRRAARAPHRRLLTLELLVASLSLSLSFSSLLTPARRSNEAAARRDATLPRTSRVRTNENCSERVRKQCRAAHQRV